MMWSSIRAGRLIPVFAAAAFAVVSFTSSGAVVASPRAAKSCGEDAHKGPRRGGARPRPKASKGAQAPQSPASGKAAKKPKGMEF